MRIEGVSAYSSGKQIQRGGRVPRDPNSSGSPAEQRSGDIPDRGGEAPSVDAARVSDGAEISDEARKLQRSAPSDSAQGSPAGSAEDTSPTPLSSGPDLPAPPREGQSIEEELSLARRAWHQAMNLVGSGVPGMLFKHAAAARLRDAQREVLAARELERSEQVRSGMRASGGAQSLEALEDPDRSVLDN